MLKGSKKIFAGKGRWLYIVLIGVIIGVAVLRFVDRLTVQVEMKKIGRSSSLADSKELKKRMGNKYLLVEADSNRSSGRYLKAVHMYRNIAKKYPDMAPAAFYEIAQTYVLSGSRDSKKIKAYREVIRKFPDSEEAGKALDGLRRCQIFKDKKVFYGEIISHYPDNKISGKALEELAKSSGDQTLFYQDLIRKYPDKYIAEVALGRMLGNILETQSREDVQKVCLKILVEYPNDKIQIAAYKQLIAYAQQGGNIQPVMDFSYSIIKDFPKTQLAETATLALADIYFQKGNYIESLRLRSSLEKEKDGK